MNFNHLYDFETKGCSQTSPCFAYFASLLVEFGALIPDLLLDWGSFDFFAAD